MKIGFLPYAVKVVGALRDVQLDDLRWPLGESPGEGTVADLSPDDHVVVYPEWKFFKEFRSREHCQVSLIIAEPYAIHSEFYKAAILKQKRFYRIITHRPFMARWAGNALVMPFGGTWVDPSAPGSDQKTRNTSLIASTKSLLMGHALRHQIAGWCVDSGQDVDLLGHAYRKLQHKSDGLLDYRFSVIIENCREEGYFTEKLIDSLLCDTLPIYWGAPDIAEYFDPDGMIICETAADIKLAIGEATPALYDRKRSALARNRERALTYTDFQKYAADELVRVSIQRAPRRFKWVVLDQVFRR